jgi:hypothetical protein
VHQAGTQALQQLPLAEDDRRLVADAARQVRCPADGLARADEPCEEERTSREEPTGDPDRCDDRDRRRQTRFRAQPALTFRSSAEIAGTTSWRSPITA